MIIKQIYHQILQTVKQAFEGNAFWSARIHVATLILINLRFVNNKY